MDVWAKGQVCSSLSQASFYLGSANFLHNSENQVTWDSDFFIHLCSAILVNNAKGRVNPSDSPSAVCIMAAHTPALQSKEIHLFVRHLLLLLNPEVLGSQCRVV